MIKPSTKAFRSSAFVSTKSSCNLSTTKAKTSSVVNISERQRNETKQSTIVSNKQHVTGTQPAGPSSNTGTSLHKRHKQNVCAILQHVTRRSHARVRLHKTLVICIPHPPHCPSHFWSCDVQVRHPSYKDEYASTPRCVT